MTQDDAIIASTSELLLLAGIQRGNAFRSTLSLGHMHFVPQNIPGVVLINQTVTTPMASPTNVPANGDVGEAVTMAEEIPIELVQLLRSPNGKTASTHKELGGSNDGDLSSDEINVNPTGVPQVTTCLLQFRPHQRCARGRHLNTSLGATTSRKCITVRDSRRDYACLHAQEQGLTNG